MTEQQPPQQHKVIQLPRPLTHHDTPDWENNVIAECMNFAQAAERNFDYGMKLAHNHLPKKMDREQRSIQLDYFIDTLLGVTVKKLTEYVNSSESFEETVVAGIKRKFAYVREKIKEIEEIPKTETT